MADSKQEKSPMEDHFNGSSQSRVVLAKPRLGGLGSRFASSSNKSNLFSNSSVLRPPQLKASTNPFMKVTENVETVSEKEKEKEKDSEASTEDRLKENKEESEAPKFIPLRSSGAPRPSNPVVAPVDTASSSSGFVFGQNLSERVVINENLNNGESSSVDHSTTNGASDLLFSSAAASVKENSSDKEEAGPSESASAPGGSLADAAAAYEREHARPPPPTGHFNVTGEEGEINVLQISCRLFAWEAGSWRERGRGVLRLNDPAGQAPGQAGQAGQDGAGQGCARLVARVAGSLRVVLNTKLWAGMVVERAGTKSLRITAADAQQQVKLFLIMGAPGDINQLHRALTARITVSKQTQNSTSQQAAERLEAAADDAEFDKANDDVYGREGPSYDNPQETADGTSVDDKDTKSLKRKEPAQDGTSPRDSAPKSL